MMVKWTSIDLGKPMYHYLYVGSGYIFVLSLEGLEKKFIET